MKTKMIFLRQIMLILGLLYSKVILAQSSENPSIEHGELSHLQTKPSQTNATITQWDIEHGIYYDKSIKSNKLLIWLAGTYGTPKSVPTHVFNTALAQGYRIIALSYITIPAVSQVCKGDTLNTNPNCAADFRQKRIYGNNTFSIIPDEPQDAIIPRLTTLIQWLNKNDNQTSWAAYLTTDGMQLNWQNIAVSGQSQGGGMAQYIGQKENIARVISFSGGWDYENSRQKKIAAWYYQDAITPLEKWYATYNVNEMAAKQIKEISEALRIPENQIFGLDKPLVEANEKSNPYHGDGIRNPVYQDIWKTMLGSGLN